MHKRLVRIVSLALAICMLGALLPVRAEAAELLPHFKDVPESSWYYSFVRTCYELGLMDGTSADTFSPGDSLTRGMMVTVLGRIARVDVSGYDGQTVFTDVPAGKYYAPYVQWALENSITEGVTDTLFAPNNPVTREQTAVLLHRFVTYLTRTSEEDPAPEEVGAPAPTDAPGEDDLPVETDAPGEDEPPIGTDVPGEDEPPIGSDAPGEEPEPGEEEPVPVFADEDTVAAWAREAVRAVYELKLMEGNERGEFLPKKQLTRAEAAAVFVRAVRLLYGFDPELVNEWFDREPPEVPIYVDPIPDVSNPIVSKAHLRDVLNAHGVKDGSRVYNALISINTVYASRLTAAQRKQPLLFLFEGCGAFSDPSLRLNALAVVVKNGKIVYYNSYSTTIPDYPFSPSKNSGTAMPTVSSGIYPVKAINHESGSTSYAALQVQNARVVRFTSKYNYYSSTSSGIHIHRRYTNTVPPFSYSWVNSCGCMLIGREGATSAGEYAKFLAAFGLVPSGYSGKSKYVYNVSGTVIVDRTQAASYLSAVGYPSGALGLIGKNAVEDEEELAPLGREFFLLCAGRLSA